MPRSRRHATAPSTLGQRIRALRIAAGLTQERFAELIDVHPRTVQKYEAGEFSPKLPPLRRIQAALGCDWEELPSD